MKHISANPIILHFYSPEELLPDDHGWKIVIVKTCNKKMDFRIASYSNKYDEWEDDHLYNIDNEDIIAWATFWPDWVVSESDRDIFGCK